MSEKKIDLSDVEVGHNLWTIQEGETVCSDIYKEANCCSIFTLCDVYRGDGNYREDDKHPSCYHNYQEFLDFHAIAPVRMTEKELSHSSEYDIIGCAYDILKTGFLLAGGQIIEELKNLPCPVCGCKMKDIEPDKSVDRFLQHPDNGCLFSKQCHQASVWNDTSKRVGK
jgi:hypothetical protein